MAKKKPSSRKTGPSVRFKTTDELLSELVGVGRNILTELKLLLDRLHKKPDCWEPDIRIEPKIAPSSEEFNFHYLSVLEQENQIKRALANGWTRSSPTGKGTAHATLLLKGDESEHWAAIWKLYVVDGTEYLVPHWLKKRMNELDAQTGPSA